eukprot:4285515-Pyramimonas_sp.AAC.3
MGGGVTADSHPAARTDELPALGVSATTWPAGSAAGPSRRTAPATCAPRQQTLGDVRGRPGPDPPEEAGGQRAQLRGPRGARCAPRHQTTGGAADLAY